MICVYKIGLVLTPGELLSWTKRVKKLTSTRHRNIILRAAHGDIFSNARLHRFNLTDNPGCMNCQEPNESIQHRLLECPNATRAWMKLNDLKVRLGLMPLSALTLENILGANDNLSKLELALNAELVHRLASSKEHPNPDSLVRSIGQFIYHSESLDLDLKVAFKREMRVQ